MQIVIMLLAIITQRKVSAPVLSLVALNAAVAATVVTGFAFTGGIVPSDYQQKSAPPLATSPSLPSFHSPRLALPRNNNMPHLRCRGLDKTIKRTMSNIFAGADSSEDTTHKTEEDDSTSISVHLSTSSTNSTSKSSHLLQTKFQVGDYYIWLYTSNGIPSSFERYEITNVSTVVGDDDLEESRSSTLVEIEMATHFPNPHCEDEITSTTGDCSDGPSTIGDHIGNSKQTMEFNVHHRMQINLSENLAAVNSKDDWRLTRFDYKNYSTLKNENDISMDEPIEKFTLQSDNQLPTIPPPWKWQSATPPGQGGENVQAFEEKFDCFSMLRRQEKQQHHDTSTLPEPVEDKLAEVALEEQRECTLNTKRIHVGRTQRHYYTGSWYGAKGCKLCGIALFKEFENPEFSFSLVEYGNVKVDGGDVKIHVEMVNGIDSAFSEI